MSEHNRGSLQSINHISDGKGLARTGDAEQGLITQPRLDVLAQRCDGCRLITGGLIFCCQSKTTGFKLGIGGATTGHGQKILIAGRGYLRENPDVFNALRK